MSTGPRTGDHELAETGRLADPDAGPYSQGLGPNLIPGVRPPEGHLLDWIRALLGEPERCFQPEPIAEDRVLRTQQVEDRRRLDAARSRQELVWEPDPETSAVVLRNLGVGVTRYGEVTETCDVHSPNVETRITLGDPVGQGDTDTASLRQSGHDRTRRPVTGQTKNRAQQRVAVGRESEGAVDHLLDTGLTDGRKVPEADFKRISDALEVGRQQAHAEVPRSLARRPGLAASFVGSQKKPATLLAQIDLPPEINAVHQFAVFAVVFGDRFDVLSEQILVLHGQHRQIEPDHPSHLACPQPPGIDHMFAADHPLLIARRSVVGVNIPAPVTGAVDLTDPGVAVQGRAFQACGFDISVCDSRRVDVAFVGVVHGPDEVLLVEQGHEPFRFSDREQFRLVAQVASAGMGHFEPVQALLRVSKHHPAREVNTAVLTGDLFDLGVQVDGVAL